MILDDIFRDLIEDLEKWHKRNDEEDVKKGLEDLVDILDDYKDSAEFELNQKEPEQDFDEEYYKNKYSDNF